MYASCVTQYNMNVPIGDLKFCKLGDKPINAAVLTSIAAFRMLSI